MEKEIIARMGFINKSDKDKLDKKDNIDYSKFLKKVYDDWDFIEGYDISNDLFSYFDNKNEGQVCTDYCHIYKNTIGYFFVPKNNPEHAGIFYLYLKFESIPLIQKIKKEKCWKVFLFFTKCATETIEVMRKPDPLAQAAIVNKVNEFVTSKQFKFFLEDVQFIEGVSDLNKFESGSK